ncbi:MAG: hypothetical protein ACK4IK_02195 [Bacteroidia bacterium]
MQITNVESGTTSADGLHIGLRNGMVQGVRLNAIFNLKENADMQFFTNNSHRMTIDRKGDIGIGTAAPQATLHLKKGANTILFERAGYATFVIQQSFGSGLSISRQNQSVPDVIITADGSVGIGSSNTGTFKLAVDGKVGAREFKVSLENPWPDYVFEENYKLMTLEDLKEFINKNKHLPGIKNSKEIKNDNGYEIGLMQIKLLEKIEELTLYILQLNAENKVLKQKIDLLTKKKFYEKIFITSVNRFCNYKLQKI